MTRSKFSEHQVIGILKQVEGGRTVAEVCREAGISTATEQNGTKWPSDTPIKSRSVPAVEQEWNAVLNQIKREILGRCEVIPGVQASLLASTIADRFEVLSTYAARVAIPQDPVSTQRFYHTRSLNGQSQQESHKAQA